MRVRFLGFSIAPEQLVDAQLEMLGFVDLKRQLRNVAHAHALQQFVADEAPGCSQRLSCLLFLHFAAIDSDVDPRGLAAGVDHHLTDIGEADAGVSEFAHDHAADLFAQRFRDAVAMVLSCPWFHHGNSP